MKYLLINTPESENIFKKSKIGLALPMMPPISLASLASVLIEEKQEVQILDLRVSNYPLEDISRVIKGFSPDYVGITFTTPLFKQATKILDYIKKLKKEVIAIAGGPHISALPMETLGNSNFDIGVIGEGERTIKEIAQNKKLSKIKGIVYKSNGKIKVTSPRELIEDIDSLPYPSWHLFDLSLYKTSRLSCRKNPVGPLETSRGCVYGCIYCSKCTFKRKFRKKSVKRVVNEMQFMINSGFREIHIMDDMFSTDLNRAKLICDEIIKQGLKFPWALINGIRVDNVDEELLIKLKDAGCYRIAFGVESGDSEVLKVINKGITLAQIRNAFKISNKTKIETIAFCMLGLPGETKLTMQKTIDLMKEVKPTLPKASIFLPLPATPIFDQWDKENRILTKNWEDYSFHSSKRVYKHPNLTDEEIYIYYNKFWREILLSPEFLFRRIIRDIKSNELIYDVYYFLRSLKFGWGLFKILR
jgi:anaerobic magnesium-protoporphyrin IX monomethyl ester cyclase